MITRGKLNASYNPFSDDGGSLLRFRTGNGATRENFDSIDEVLSALIDES